jgi:hypothetical protein
MVTKLEAMETRMAARARHYAGRLGRVLRLRT